MRIESSAGAREPYQDHAGRWTVIAGKLEYDDQATQEGSPI